MDLMAAVAGRTEAVAVGATVPLPFDVCLHNLSDDSSAAVPHCFELFNGEGSSHYYETIAIEDSLSVFDAIRRKNFKARNAVLVGEEIALSLQLGGFRVATDPPVAHPQGHGVTHRQMLSPDSAVTGSPHHGERDRSHTRSIATVGLRR